MKRLLRAALLIAFAALLVYGYARYIEPNRLVVRSVRVTAANWPGGGSPLSVAQLSDLHLPTMSPGLKRKVLDAVRVAAPEMIVITGDLFSTSRVMEPDNHAQLAVELDQISRFLAQMQAPLGIWAVRGNHDLGDDKEVSDRLVHLLRGQGIHLLTNQKAVISWSGRQIALLGLDFSARDSAVVRPFTALQEAEEFFLQSGPSKKNSYTHYCPDGADSPWADYTLSARLRVSNDKKSGAGVTFYSQMDQGLDHYYRLRWSPTENGFRFSPHNAALTHGQMELPVAMTADSWYHCKVEVRTEARQTRMAAKAWREGEAEPETWQAVAFDSSAARLQAGTVGLWSIFDGLHRFDDLLVVSEKGDTLLQEGWEKAGRPFKPAAWIDFHYNEPALPLLMTEVPDPVFTLLLCHDPETAAAAAALGVDLMLSGHTHGGQLRLPLLGSPGLKYRYGRSFIKGLYRVGAMPLYVHAGLGVVWLPWRFLAPPEIAIFEISAP